ncbi:ferritin family protein [Caballeronia grimmiae]|uniref:hypothetical protein n=1 Tax=Caballeronia grimmiae TaxID=1071679 RepID=UPI0038BB3F76
MIRESRCLANSLHGSVGTRGGACGQVRSQGKQGAIKLRAETYLKKGLVHLLGPRFVLPRLLAVEFADRNEYAGNKDTARISEDENQHANIVQAMANANEPAAAQGPDIAQAESWHRGVASGNDLRAVVLGANDGLVKTSA